jgi:hypothetical protein
MTSIFRVGDLIRKPGNACGRLSLACRLLLVVCCLAYSDLEDGNDKFQRSVGQSPNCTSQMNILSIVGDAESLKPKSQNA